MDMEPWYALIAEVGFPIAVTFYLLHRIEGKLNLLIKTIQELPGKMSGTIQTTDENKII